jgi:hypothetical protein
MGLGKTLTAFLFLTIYTRWAYTNMKIHKPVLLLCPSGVVLDQWQKLGEEHFPDLTILIAFGENPSNGSVLSKLNWINSKAVKFGPTNPKLGRRRQDISLIEAILMHQKS